MVFLMNPQKPFKIYVAQYSISLIIRRTAKLTTIKLNFL